jgi:hypothetical protein
MVAESPLMKVVEVIQEELHIPRLFDQYQAGRLFCHNIAVRKLLESAVRNWIALNIA